MKTIIFDQYTLLQSQQYTPKKSILLLLFFLGGTIVSHAQSEKDSDPTSCYHEKYEGKEWSGQDSIEATKCLGEGIRNWLSLHSNFEKAEEYAAILYQYTEDSQNPKIKIRAYETKAALAMKRRAYDLAIPQYQKARDLAQIIFEDKTSHVDWQEDLLRNTYQLASTYKFARKYEEAKIDFLKTIELAKEFNSYSYQGKANSGLGIVSDLTEKYEEAIKYYDQAIFFAEKEMI